MARKLKPGQIVNGYTVNEFISAGAFALAYRATAASGETVFFKQYKMPSVSTPWYSDYVQCQKELKRRIESTSAKGYCYRIVDFFEADIGHRCYFQVFEFVDKGEDLQGILDRVRGGGGIGWEQRVIMSKVLMSGVKALHEASVVHTDLKPHNVQLFEDPSIAAKYRVKLIDMDFSILADQPAPWHGDSSFSYVGSPGYMSPEHLTGKIPEALSDVFTCGLMLYELLSDGHPYLAGGIDDYSPAVLAHRASPPRLAGTMPAPAKDDDVAAVIHACLDPDIGRRPTAKDVGLVLNGLAGRPAPRPRAPTPPPTTAPTAPTTAPSPTAAPSPTTAAPPAPTTAASTGALELVGESGQVVRCSIRTTFGRHLCAEFGPDSKYCDQLQFAIVPSASGWQVDPNLSAQNETLLNGKALHGLTPLHDGDVLAVGREAKGVAKLPMRVKLT